LSSHEILGQATNLFGKLLTEFAKNHLLVPEHKEKLISEKSCLDLDNQYQSKLNYIRKRKVNKVVKRFNNKY
jgi:hypothetical protein